MKREAVFGVYICDKCGAQYDEYTGRDCDICKADLCPVCAEIREEAGLCPICPEWAVKLDDAITEIYRAAGREAKVLQEGFTVRLEELKKQRQIEGEK